MNFTARELFSSCILSVATFALFASPGWTQQYPTKPVRMIVPISAGGTGDTLARVLAERLAENFRQQVVVENRPGANGIIGTEAVVKAAPDGHTLLLASTGNIAINPGLYGAQLPFDPERDLAPVTQVANTSYVLIVHPSLPAKTVKELITLAKARPGQLDYVSPGNGSSAHLNTALFASMAGIRINPIVYRGSTPGRVALVAGEVPIYIDGMIPALPLIQTGRVRALGVTSAQRSSILPDVPAIAEFVPGYVGYVWYGVFAPAATPKDVIARLHSAIVTALKNPELRARLAGQGAEVVGNSPAEFSAYIRAEIVKWTKVIKDSGAKAD